MPFNEIIGTEAGEDLSGTAVADRIVAGAGDDAVDGYEGADLVFGQDGDDLISAGAGNDTVYGGAGNDRIYASFVSALDTDVVYGGGGDDLIAINSPNGGAVYGGAGFDTLAMILSIDDAGFAIALPPADGSALTNPGGLLLASIDALSISLGRGDDTVTGGRFADHIEVRSGANVVEAGAGDDYIAYVAGATNHIAGGSGIDTLHVEYTGADALVLSVTDGSVSDGFGSVITGADHYEVYGSSGDDQVQLGGRADVFGGSLGNDRAEGRDGADTLLGGGGADSLDGGNGDDRLLGDYGDDSLQGGVGHDLLRGGAGADTLAGGAYRDVLRGGGGADVFRLDSGAAAADTLRDLLSGTDRIEIDVTLIGYGLALGAVDAGHLAFGRAGNADPQFVYLADANSNGRLYWDSNGSDAGGRSLIAVLYGNPLLDAGDLFIV